VQYVWPAGAWWGWWPAGLAGVGHWAAVGRVFTVYPVDAGDNSVVIRLRTGDRAIIVGAVAIAVYERVIADDADLISSRVAAYKQHHPVLTLAIVWITAAHLTELLHPSVDPYHQAVKYFRRHVGAQE